MLGKTNEVADTMFDKTIKQLLTLLYKMPIFPVSEYYININNTRLKHTYMKTSTVLKQFQVVCIINSLHSMQDFELTDM